MIVSTNLHPRWHITTHPYYDDALEVLFGVRGKVAAPSVTVTPADAATGTENDFRFTEMETSAQDSAVLKAY